MRTDGEDERDERGRGGVASCAEQVACETADLFIVELVRRCSLEEMLGEASVGRSLRRDVSDGMQKSDRGDKRTSAASLARKKKKPLLLLLLDMPLIHGAEGK